MTVYEEMKIFDANFGARTANCGKAGGNDGYSRS